MVFIIICSILFVIAIAFLIYEEKDNIITSWYDFKDMMEDDIKKKKEERKKKVQHKRNKQRRKSKMKNNTKG